MATIITTILVTILTPLMGLLVWQIQRIISVRENDSNGIKTLLKAYMRERHDKYINQTYITSDELAEYRELYEAYHSLKGNGKGTIWMEDMEKLERKED